MDELDSAGTLSRFRWGASALLRCIALACFTIFCEAQADEKDKLAPEVEKAFGEFAKKAADSRLETVNAAVEKYAAGLADEVGLDAAAQDRFAEHFPKIVEAAQAVWQDRFKENLRPSLAAADDPLQILERWNAKSMASSPYYAWGRPDRTEAWRAALGEVLSPGQQKKYAAAEKTRLEKLLEELEDYFLTSQDWARSRLEPVMDAEIEELKKFAEIDEERLGKLRAAAKTAVAEIVKDWLERHKSQTLEMEDSVREARMRSQGFSTLNTSGKEDPRAHQAWLDGIANTLTGVERERIEKRRTELRGTRSQALAMVLVEALDPFIGFTADQRTNLAKIFTEPLLGLPDYYFAAPAAGGGYYSTNPGQMFTQISAIAKTEVLPLLDDGQVERWQGISPQTLSRNNYSSRGKVVDLDIPPAEEIDAVEAQRLITAFVYLQAKEYTRGHRLRMEAKVDHLARVGNLAAEQISVLRTAAKGAAQSLASNDFRNLENWARQNFQNVKPADLPARLKVANMPSYSNRMPAEDPKIWTATVERLLSSDQKEAWDAECEAEQLWRRKCQIAVVLSEIDKVLLLTPEKRSVLQGILASFLSDYEKELDRMFSFQWHLQGYYSMIPFAGLSDEELAPALDKEQIATVRGRDPGHFGNMIENLKRNRKTRLKAEKKK